MNLNVGIIGAGTLGTALSQQISKNVDELTLFLRNSNLCDDINNLHMNTQYYPNILLRNNIKATLDLNDLSQCDVIFLAIPSSAFREVLDNLKGIVRDDVILVTTVKGIEYPSLKTMGNLIEEYINAEYVVMSGPNFASEMMLDFPTFTNIASKNRKNSEKVKSVLSTSHFKVKIIDDYVGIELCGILKNINAIANGICEGMNINENAKFGILTHGFRDTIEIMKSFGGSPETVLEYCGFGDFMLTSMSTESRNHTLGILYGQRMMVDDQETGVVFEGKNSIMAINDICNNNDVHSDIVDFVYSVIIEKETPKKAFNELIQKIE